MSKNARHPDLYFFSVVSNAAFALTMWNSTAVTTPLTLPNPPNNSNSNGSGLQPIDAMLMIKRLLYVAIKKKKKKKKKKTQILPAPNQFRYRIFFLAVFVKK